MTANILTCRNCLSENTFISNRANVAPFFAKRVFDIEAVQNRNLIWYAINLSFGRLSKLLANSFFKIIEIFPDGKAFMDAYSPMCCELIVCKQCSFVGPKIPIPEELLNNLYVDYRSDSYNADRSFFEPSYKDIMNFVGKNDLEVKSRLLNVEDIISGHIDLLAVNDVLDYGGGDGRFIPDILAKKNVTILDPSNERCVNERFVRCAELVAGIKFDYIQVCHVLEHVSEPNAKTLEILELLNLGGYLYVEVPQDKTDEELKLFLVNSLEVSHTIHEHINLYSEKSIEALGRSLNLEVVYLRKKTLDVGWTKAEILSALFRKNFNS
jgi:SAM-dependent methyltransferase